MNYWVYIVLIVMSLVYAGGANAEARDPTQPDYVADKATNNNGVQLSAIIISAKRRIAVINGQIMQVGDQMGEGRITSIEPNTVQVQGADGKIAVFLLNQSVKKVSGS